jgi:hypothetical protein
MYPWLNGAKSYNNLQKKYQKLITITKPQKILPNSKSQQKSKNFRLANSFVVQKNREKQTKTAGKP